MRKSVTKSATCDVEGDETYDHGTWTRTNRKTQSNICLTQAKRISDAQSLLLVRDYASDVSIERSPALM
jgi:hypothetical protein